jgi:hypothetical protein
MIKYKIGWYANDLEEVEDYWTEYHEVDNLWVETVATQFADEHHQIDEDSDMKFSVFVEIEDKLHEVKFHTEFDPVYYVDEVI